jgi:hypothetical protein
MIETRLLDDADIPTIVKFHESMGYDYRMPDLRHPLFVVKMVARQDDAIVAACALKIQAETYLWVDGNASLRTRVRAIIELSKAIYAEAYRIGLDCMVAYLPPGLPVAFRRVMQFIGWSADRQWEPWSKEVQ